MKKTIFECDLCHKDYDEKTTTNAQIYIITNGKASERIDLCNECKDKMLEFIKEQPTEKGGAE